MNASCSVKQVNEFASEFYARGTGPNNHERACSGGTVAQVPQASMKWRKVFQGMEAQGVLADARDSEVIRYCSSGQHQLAVRQLVTTCCCDDVIFKVDGADRVLNVADPPPLQELPVVGGDFPSLQLPAEQFVEKGNKDEP